MFGLGKHGPDGHYGAIVDVGSGSVGVAIVVSDPLEKGPIIIWTHRENISRRDHANLDVVEKDITTALVNAVLELGSNGTKALRKHDSKAAVKFVQVAISAPWSFTVSRTVTLAHEESFTVNQSILEELAEKASKEATEELQASEELKSAVTLISSTTTNIELNGYSVRNPFTTPTKKVIVSQLIGLGQNKIVATLEEVLEKVLPGCDTKIDTFMFLYFQALRSLATNISEVCLMDVTAEGTEIGIIRDSILRYTTHIPSGTRTFARKFGDATKTTVSEGLSYMTSSASNVSVSLTPTHKENIEILEKEYETNLEELFTLTGDALSIPKTIFLHAPEEMEGWLEERISNAAKKILGRKPNIHLITSKYLQNEVISDSALLLSSYVFHKQLYGSSDIVD